MKRLAGWADTSSGQAGTPRPWAARAAAAVVVVTIVGAGLPTAQALEGSTPAAAVAAATVRIDVAGNPAAAPGETRERACSGALVGASWVLTAASCFADAPGAAVPAGSPAWATTATVGRADLTGTSGQVVTVDRIVPHPERDVVLAHLATQVTATAPVAVATSAPEVGDTLTVSGYGRTAGAVVPDTVHAAAYAVAAVGETTFDIAPAQEGAAVCKGDAGGPALRMTATGGIELVAIHHTAHQGGCLGAVSTRREATESRVDDLGPWIAEASVPKPGDAGFETLWVAALYRDVLGRVGDKSEHGFWAAKIPKGATLTEVATGIADSAEWRRKFVTERYRTLLGREPDAGGLNVYTSWFDRGKDTFAITHDILSSPEYFSRVGGNDTALIKALYRDVLGRQALAWEIEFWTSRIGSHGRATMLYEMVYSTEHVDRVVGSWHREMLGRTATSAEIRAAANRLWAGGTVQQLLVRLAVSDEYRDTRVGAR